MKTGLTEETSPDIEAGRVPARSGFSPLSRLRRLPVAETLAYRDFRWVFLGSFASFMAMNMQLVTQSWLVVELMNDSPLALSLSIVSFTAPITVVSLFGGVMADRIPRRHLVIFSQSGNAVMTFLLATLDATGLIVFWQVMAIGFINGSMMAFNMPSRQAIISDIVPESRLMNAISVNNSSMNLTRVVGPATAGFLILLIDTWAVFYLVSVVYVFAALSMAMVRAGSEGVARSGKGMRGDIGAGLSYVAQDPTRRGLIIMSFIPALFGYSYYALLPAWGREALDIGSEDLGLLMMLMGVGALVGTLILASMQSFNRRGRLSAAVLPPVGCRPGRVRPDVELPPCHTPVDAGRAVELRVHVSEHDAHSNALLAGDARAGDEHCDDKLRGDAPERECRSESWRSSRTLPLR